MTREDRLIDILGDLSDKYVAMAAPRSGGYDTDTEVRRIVFENETIEISEADIRRYRVFQALKITAAAAVILTAAGLLWANRDNIAVSGGEQPSVTTGTADYVTPGAAASGNAQTSDTAPDTAAAPDTSDTSDSNERNADAFNPFFSATGTEQEWTDVDISEELTFTVEHVDSELRCTWTINEGSILEQADIDSYVIMYSQDGENFSELKTYDSDTDRCRLGIEGWEDFPIYLVIQCRFTYEDTLFGGISEKVIVEQ